MIKSLLICITFFLYANSASAELINIYDSVSNPGHIVIEAVDDCNFSHKLLISLELSTGHKPTDWLELLIISGEWNKCLTDNR